MFTFNIGYYYTNLLQQNKNFVILKKNYKNALQFYDNMYKQWKAIIYIIYMLSIPTRYNTAYQKHKLK